jgi:hypothetical protein
MDLRRLVALVCACSSSLLAAATAAAVPTGADGYTYAGLQATGYAAGIQATITALRAPSLASGHVAGWIGVGGPKQGPNGSDMWFQAGLAARPDEETFLYAEIALPGRTPALIRLEDHVPVGQSRRVAVLELRRRPGHWRIWIDGRPATAPVFLPGSSGRWAPIATAESWSQGPPACHDFAFRFDRVSVRRRLGGAWTTFEPGYRFLDRHKVLRRVAGTLTASGRRPGSYSFVAASACP